MWPYATLIYMKKSFIKVSALAVLLAVLILGDRPSGINWAGVVLIAIGAYLAALPAVR